MFEQVVIGGIAVAGLVAGWSMQRVRSRRILQRAEELSQRKLRDARRAGKLTLRESQAQSREEILELQRNGSVEQQAYEDECGLILERLRKLETRLEKRREGLTERQQAIDERHQAVRSRQDEGKRTRAAAGEARRAARGRLEERAGQTAAEIREQIASALVVETQSHCADRLRNLEASEAGEFERRAERIMGIAMQRCTNHYPRERSTAVVALEPRQLARLREGDGHNLQLLKELTGVEVAFAEDESSLRIETGDGVLREVCRRCIVRFMDEERIKDPERLVKAIRKDITREVSDHGKRAFSKLGLEPAAEEISDLVGKLNWRTSYTQNQYWHSIEAAALGAMMGAELGLDPRIAARSTLLHDIGKALTHAAEGSHALIGAELARKNGEMEEVANAIGAHHGEEPMGSPYAWLATAADAMSGGRPGARREITEAYADRIGDLEKVASGFKGVQVAHAVQAGRELRVLVNEQQVGDEQLPELSEQIARKISEELVFPGQIRVTVIRDFRVVAEAN